MGEDELFVVHETAVQAHEIINTGSEDLTLIKFFGPDNNPDVPAAGLHPSRE